MSEWLAPALALSIILLVQSAAVAAAFHLGIKSGRSEPLFGPVEQMEAVEAEPEKEIEIEVEDWRAE